MFVITASDMDCNFNDVDHPVCEWTQDTDDDFDWSFSESAVNSGTGPQTDHSLTNSKNLYVIQK